MQKFIATVNVPGYLPDSADPAPTFDTAAEAWTYLAEEETRGREDMAYVPDNEEDPDGTYSLAPYVLQLEEKAREGRIGTVYGPEFAYSVDYAEED